MSNTGIVAAIMALLVGATQAGKQPGKTYGIPDVIPIDTTPAPGPVPSSPDEGTYVPGVSPNTRKIANVFETPGQADTTTPTTPGLTGLTILNVSNIPAGVTNTLGTTTALPDPIRTQINNVAKARGWSWYTPGGTVTSRPPTEEEKESGLGCPEVPDIWTYPGASQQNLHYCANPQCPSNLPEVQPDGTVLSPTPAVLEQQISGGIVSYYCRVCRTTQ